MADHVGFTITEVPFRSSDGTPYTKYRLALTGRRSLGYYETRVMAEEAGRQAVAAHQAMREAAAQLASVPIAVGDRVARANNLRVTGTIVKIWPSGRADVRWDRGQSGWARLGNTPTVSRIRLSSLRLVERTADTANKARR